MRTTMTCVGEAWCINLQRRARPWFVVVAPITLCVVLPWRSLAAPFVITQAESGQEANIIVIVTASHELQAKAVEQVSDRAAST